MNVQRVSYYGRRLGTARIGEPFWRLRLWLRHGRQRRLALKDPDAFSIDRLYSTRDIWLKTPTDKRISSSIHDSLKKTLPEGWLADGQFWKLFAELYPEHADSIVQRAKEAATGSITLFHWKKVEAGCPVRWSSTFDETSPGEQWHADFYADAKLHYNPDHPHREIKWCWELNRFQHLLWFGAAWRITKDDRFAWAAREHLEDWIDSARYPMGVQWSSNLEVALRVLAWTRCHVLCLGSRPWDEEFTSIFMTALYREAAHLEKELTIYHPANNHLLGEASALLYIALCYPVFSDSDRWKARSVSILQNLVPRLIHADGVYGEQSTGYFRFVAEFLLPLMHLLEAYGGSLPNIVRERVTAAMEFIGELVPEGCDIPMIGDSDSGSAVGWQLEKYWNFSFLRAAAAVVLRVPSLTSGIERFPVESFLMLGIPGLESFNALQGAGSITSREAASSGDRNQRVRHFPHGGYQISRDSIFNIIFDAGPLGIYPGAGHGHADALSFILYYRGVPAVVDPGTYFYNGNPAWRNFFRSTPAHNTVSIDGGNQAEALRTFAWSEPLKVRQEAPVSGNGWSLMQGSIRWNKAVHVRYVLHLLDRALLILDHLEGSSDCEIQWSLNWAPEWALKNTESRIVKATSPSGDIRIVTLWPEGAELAVLVGSHEPMGGWHSRLYGSKVASPTLTGRVLTVLPASMVTCLYPAGKEFTVPSDVLAYPFPEAIRDLLNSADFSVPARRSDS